MEPASAAAMLAARNQAQIASAAAAKMMKMNAQAGEQLVAMLEQSTESMQTIAAETAAGVGGNVDVTV